MHLWKPLFSKALFEINSTFRWFYQSYTTDRSKLTFTDNTQKITGKCGNKKKSVNDNVINLGLILFVFNESLTSWVKRVDDGTINNIAATTDSLNSMSRMVVPAKSVEQEHIETTEDARKNTLAKKYFASESERKNKEENGPSDDEEVFFNLRKQKQIALQMKKKAEIVSFLAKSVAFILSYHGY